jgi:superfamily II DNA/RNA helicase
MEIEMTFTEMGVSSQVTDALCTIGITTPTPIQEKTYSPIIDGRDVIGCSQTGSGKTLAYVLPLLARIDAADSHVQALIVVPTQELGIQVLRQIQTLSDKSGINVRSIQLIGDGNINRQIEALKLKPHIVVGTCGRIIKLLKMKKLSVHNVKTLVVDEADKMLSKDNVEGLTDVRKALMKYTQVLMFSASMDSKAIRLAGDYNSNPLVIKINDETSIPTTIRHMYIITERRDRIDVLRKVIAAMKPKKSIIFANTAYDIEETIDKLKFHHYKAESLYGSDNQLARKNSVEAFRTGKLNFLVSTDLASRGLQINDIDIVINVNLPEDVKEYQHRAGRCGRNGKMGTVISIITENELTKLKTLQKEFKINIIPRKLYNGKLVRG